MTSHLRPSATQCIIFMLPKKTRFIDLAKGKADDRAGTRAVALGHVMLSLCLGLCIIGALSSTLVSGLSLSKGTFHPELTATEREKKSLIKERTLCLSDVNSIALSLSLHGKCDQQVMCLNNLSSLVHASVTIAVHCT